MSANLNQKLLWRIELLWNEYYRKSSYCVVFNEKAISKSILEKFFADGTFFNFFYCENFDFNQSSAVSFFDDYGSYYGLAKNQVMQLDEKLVYLFDNHNKFLVPMYHHDYGSYYGLAKNQVMQLDEKLVYLFDNHNKFLVPMYHLYTVLGRPLRILHIDAHPDDAKYQGLHPNILNEQTLHHLLATTRIGDFFDAISQTSAVTDITRIHHSQSFQDFVTKSYDILSLDIDIFGPEGDFVELEEKIKVIAAAWRNSPIITIATSPGFIDQSFARGIIEILGERK